LTCTYCERNPHLLLLALSGGKMATHQLRKNSAIGSLLKWAQWQVNVSSDDLPSRYLTYCGFIFVLFLGKKKTPIQRI
jgi:hypothetical protein